jgi:hypothetical protein
VLRSTALPEQMVDSLRTVVRSMDPQLALDIVQSLESIVAEGRAPQRFSAVLVSSFAAIAVVLASTASSSLPHHGSRRWPSGSR